MWCAKFWLQIQEFTYIWLCSEYDNKEADMIHIFWLKLIIFFFFPNEIASVSDIYT